MFHTVQRTTRDAVEGDLARPWLHSATVHEFNSIIAWADILITAQSRSFSPRMAAFATAFVTCYALWINIVKMGESIAAALERT